MKGRYHEVAESSAGYYDITTVHHEYDDHGNHRLQIEGCVGDWYIYGTIAQMNWKGIRFGATTEYYYLVLPEIFVIHNLKDHDIP
jgi:hypothetical protein